MALPLPQQLSTDPTVNAAAMAWAAQLVDALNRRLGGYLTVERQSNQSIPSAVQTTVILNVIVAQSAQPNEFSLDTSTGIIKVLRPGLYLATGQIYGTVTSEWVGMLMLAGSERARALNTGFNDPSPAAARFLDAGQAITLDTYQGSGAAQNCTAHLTVARLA